MPTPVAPPRSSFEVGGLLLFGVTVFLSAFLLFQVQPVIAKFILPWFGASPGVWATCMLFFQLLLLGGYAYAHFVVSRLPGRRQAVVHIVLLGLALLTLPITPDEALKPIDGAAPTARILWALAVSVGVPYLLLSSTGPLLQGWFARLNPGRSPYRLYALSNVGSLLALLSYPFIFERYMRLRGQTGAWSIAYVAFALLCAACAWRLLRGSDAAGRPRRDESDGPEPAAAPEPEEEAPRPRRTDIVLWLLLAACGSALLLATTNQMCLDVAAVPFLWILPLCLYLLTFILSFDHARWYVRSVYCCLLPVVLGVTLTVIQEGVDLGIVKQVTVYAAALFVMCMCCHGELARLKPHPRHLTFFFLVVSIGGAVGGFFVAVVAPHVFPGFYEYHLLLVLCCALVFVVILRQGLAAPTGADRPRWTRVLAGTGWALFVVAVAFGTAQFFDTTTWVDAEKDPAALDKLEGWLFNFRNAAIALPLLLFLYLDGVRWRRKIAFRAWWTEPRRLLVFSVSAVACLGLVSLTGALGWTIVEDDDYIVQERNFYGVLRVEAFRKGTDKHYWSLYNGRINHGFQYKNYAAWPVSYYGPSSGLGLAIRRHPRRGAADRQFRIGVVGLGTGIVAAYANAIVDPARGDLGYVIPTDRKLPDRIGYYEINPLVETWAGTYFSYLADARARGAEVDVFMGDARLVMERQIARGEVQGFDVLGIDAFTGDAIPIHLLTRESLAIYWQHLKPDGILAIHVSNRYLDLVPVVRRLGEELGKAVIYVDNEAVDERGVDSSDWVLLTNNAGFVADEEVMDLKTSLPPAGPLWSDDYSSVFELIKMGADAAEDEPYIEDGDPEVWGDD